MPRKSREEKIAEIEKREGQLAARKYALECQAKDAAKKARNREKIIMGGILIAMGLQNFANVQELQRLANSPESLRLSLRDALDRAAAVGR